MFFNQNVKKERPLFPTIAKNIRFEADENKQNDKELDEKLDSQLDNLKDKTNGGNNDVSNGNQSGNTSNPDSGQPDPEGDNINSGDNPADNGAQGDDPDASGSGFGDAGSGDSSGGEDVGGPDVDGRETDKFGHSAVRETTRPVDRKLGLFAEFNKLDTGIRNAISALNGTNADSPSVKDVLSQLEDVKENLSHIMEQFPTFTEKELLLHYDLLKERVKAATVCLTRIREKKAEE